MLKLSNQMHRQVTVSKSLWLDLLPNRLDSGWYLRLVCDLTSALGSIASDTRHAPAYAAQQSG
jgi:hypothetical protein